MDLVLDSLIVVVAYDKGTLLSPLLFVVVMKASSGMLSAAVDSGSYQVFLVGSRNSDELLVSHLLFADTLIFCEANLNHFRYLCSLSFNVLKLS
jgi:hypothetical protein